MKYDRATTEAICELHFEDGWSYGRLAAVFGMTRCAIAGLIHRNRERYEAERAA